MTAGILFGALILFLLMSIPIGISLGLSSLVCILMEQPISMETFTQSMMQGLNSFPLMAVPLFTFAGEIMGQGGISKRLLNVTKIFVGRFTGGLGIVTIITCLFFGAISGTGSAAVAAIGIVMIPTMVKANYDRGFSSALVATAGTVGVIIPPSVCMVVYAVASGASISSLFMAGILPGLLIGLVLIIYTIFYSKKKGYKGEQTKYTFKEAMHIIGEAIPGLLIPVIILGGIYGGIFTPTEAAAIASAYAIIVSIFIYKEVQFKDLMGIAYRSCLMCGTVLVIIGISTGFGRILTITQVPEQIAEVILSITNSKILILLLINLLLLMVGTFMETNAAIIILTPILLPVVTVLGVNPIHFGIIMIMNLAIGFITPPLGANLFMACQVGDITFDNLVRKIFPWIVVMIIVLMIVTFIPEISLILPRILGMNL
ncbi:TRAP transporter large permease [Niameybacter massiliensis]|uniref:TRAP transporter large permease n=1 Tax=Niameybacter massiliensis TaxID=1658108 RepID=UPI0006B426B1|nr:TRAP transporter large permease [Niameybacter massiliensis]